MQTCPKCHQPVRGHQCSSCTTQAPETDKRPSAANHQATPAGSRPPLPLDNFAARFIYARLTPFLLMALLAFEIVSCLKFLQGFREYYHYGLFDLPFLKMYAPMLVLLFINLLMLFRFREFHRAKSRQRSHPTFCLFVFFWFAYMRTIALSAGFWLINHF